MSPQTKTDAVKYIAGNNDVLCGRGGEIYARAGNKRYRGWVKERREAYSLCEKKEKKMVYAREVFDLVKSLKPPGRFLQKINSDLSQLVEISDERALHKTSQALREGAPAIRAQAKQKKDIFKSMRAAPQWGQIMQPFVPFYPCYGTYHQANISMPNYTDTVLGHRLNNFEAVLGRLVQCQTLAYDHLSQNLSGTHVLQSKSQQLPSKIEPSMSKEALLKDIECISREVLEIRNKTKRCLNWIEPLPNKKARV